MKVRIPKDKQLGCTIDDLGTREEKLLYASYGFEDRGEIRLFDNRLLNIREQIRKIPYIKIEDAKLDELTIKENTAEFFEKNFKLHDVLYADKDDIINIYKNGVYTEEELTKKIHDVSNLVSPFSIPIVTTNDKVVTGEVVKIKILVSEELARKMENVFNKIHLGIEDTKALTKISACIYAHELTHVLLESKKGSVKKAENNEMLSIFMEKLAALEMDESLELLRSMECIRLKFFADDNIESLRQISSVKQKFPNISYSDILKKAVVNGISYNALLRFSQYLVSTLEAEKLFNIYFNGDESIRNEIIFEIQKAFDGKQTVEDLLDKYNITYENSMDSKMYENICKSLIK